MIHENHHNMIMREYIHEFVNKLIFKKKLVSIENKKETYRKL